jgi:hypothetical protein
MRFRTGLIVGLAVGYYYGAKAGRERFELIDAWLDKVRGTTTYQDLSIKAHDALRFGTTNARRVIEDAAFGDRQPGDAAGRTDSVDLGSSSYSPSR